MSPTSARGPMRLLLDLPARRPLVGALLLVNAFGTVYGFWWYHEQLALTPPALWPLVPDSPLATLSFTLFLAGWLRGRVPAGLAALAYLSSLKYGLWTPAVMAHFWVTARAATFESVHLSLSHLGMALEALLFMRVRPSRPAASLAAAAWLLFNDYMDYARGLHPFLPVPGPGARAFAGAAAVSLSALALALALGAWRMARAGRPPAGRA